MSASQVRNWKIPKPAWRVLAALLFIATLAAFGHQSYSRASELEDSLRRLQEKRQEYEQKIAELQSREKTLKNEIALMDNQINVTSLRIEEVETAIRLRQEELLRLVDDIDLISGKIDSLGQSLAQQKVVFSKRAATSYKSSKVSFLDLFFGGFGFSYFINRTKYLRVIEAQDSKFLKQIEDTRQVFQGQKIILDDKRTKVEQIKVQIEDQKKELERYKASLTRQKGEKQNLLSLTFNDEDKYQRLLTQILSEIESVARSLKGGVRIGEVKKGDLIAREGNSGCVVPSPTGANPTAGSHLHFGVYKEGVAQDPRPYLDRGELAWPQLNPVITQNFGENSDFYRRNFGISGHNALDLTAGFGSPILAAADGVAYETGDSKLYGSWCNGKAKGIRVEHDGGLITIYWHVL